MTSRSSSRHTDQPAGGVTIGDVDGDIRRTTIAGRDVIETTIDQLVYNVFEDASQFKEQRDRQDVLELMNRVWIRNVLERSRPETGWSEPVLELRPDAVSDPWGMIVQVSNQSRELLPPGTTLVDLFQEMEGSLLLLGEPGVGKTTELLRLARQAIAWAEADPAQPIPVVLDLAWWTERGQTLSDWLLNMLRGKYLVRSDTARIWLENDELCLLLNNLDRIQPRKHRERCVQALNDFLQEHGLAPVVVCCRTDAYQALETRLQLQGAVCIVGTQA